MSDANKTHELVRRAYGRIAVSQNSCCGSGAQASGGCCTSSDNTVAMHPVPEADLGLSCGNPLAFGYISEGDVVLDLGSGAGKDVFLAAEKVGASGRAIGVDMTPEMLELARHNAEKFRQTTGLANVEFREGFIEDLPVDSASVDLVISNCVINLSPDKPRVFREIYRVLRPGGRMIVSDIVLNRPLPGNLRDDDELYASCLAGALLRADYLSAIQAAGFATVKVVSDSDYKASQAGDDPVTGPNAKALAQVSASITVMAEK